MPLSEEQRGLLESWKEDANVLLYANFAQAETFRKRNTYLGAVSAALSAMVGTAVFASIGKNSSLYSQIIVGLTSVLAAVLAALHTFLNFNELEMRHQKAGAGYASIRKRIEGLIAVPPSDPQELRDILARIQSDWDALREGSVPMSARTLRKAAAR